MKMKRELLLFLCLLPVWGACENPASEISATARTILIDRPWLLLPVLGTSTNGVVLELLEDERQVRKLNIALASETADWWAPIDVSTWIGKTLVLRVQDTRESGNKLKQGLAKVYTATQAYPETLYRESLRPQFHLTAARGWMNDPNGLVCHRGEYHVFFQHNPYSLLPPWTKGVGNGYWGHAVSRDFLHWRHLPEAVYPDPYNCNSGSAATDCEGTAGLGKGIVALVYNSNLVTSQDGRKFTPYPKNLVLSRIHTFSCLSDPRIFWYAPGHHWVMAYYAIYQGHSGIALFTSKDLKTWKETCLVMGNPMKNGRGDYLFECPDLYELPIAGEKKTRWILTGANGMYAVGQFNGETFVPEEERLPGNIGAYYAGQTFNDTPDGRRILLLWLRAPSPNMPFTQTLSLPHELELLRTPAGLRQTHKPFHELEKLRRNGGSPLVDFSGELLEAVLDCRLREDSVVNYSLRGVPVIYDAKKKALTAAKTTVPYTASNGHLQLHAFLDRTTLEIFSDDGLFVLAVAVIPDSQNHSARVSAQGLVTVQKDWAWRLGSIWE